MRTFFVAVLANIALFSNGLAAQADPRYDAVNAAVAAAAQRDGAPGLQFAAERDGHVVDAQNFGYADVETKTSVSSDTIFALASCSKPFTAMAIMQLIDAGKLTLSTPAFGYLGLHPAHAPAIAAITIQELLNHSSGLPRQITAESADPVAIATKAAALNRLLFRPGTQVAYSNTGFNVLGAVVAKASGEDYQSYVTGHVFAPAGVTDAGYLGNTTLPHIAVGYAGRRAVPNTRLGSQTPAGGWVMSATDAVRILAAYDAGKIVTPSARKAMLTPQNVALGKNGLGGYYGLGWDIVESGSGVDSYAKNGDIPGYGAWFEHRGDGTVFAVLRNSAKGTSTHPKGLTAVETALDRAH